MRSKEFLRSINQFMQIFRLMVGGGLALTFPDPTTKRRICALHTQISPTEFSVGDINCPVCDISMSSDLDNFNFIIGYSVQISVHDKGSFALVRRYIDGRYILELFTIEFHKQMFALCLVTGSISFSDSEAYISILPVDKILFVIS